MTRYIAFWIATPFGLAMTEFDFIGVNLRLNKIFAVKNATS